MRQSFAKWQENLTLVHNHSISGPVFPDTVDAETLELLPYRPDEDSEDFEHDPPDVEQCRINRTQIPRPNMMTRILQLIPNFKPTGIRRFLDNNAGLLLVALSQAFFAVMNVSVKILNSLDTPVSTLQLVFVRMGITYICGITYMLLRSIEDPWIGPKGVRLLLAFRGFSGFFGLFGIYYSLEYLSLSDATVLTFLAPLCTAMAGSLVLNEKFSWKEVVAGVFCLTGVILIARPPFLFGQSVDPGIPVDHTPLSNSTNMANLIASPAEKGTPQQRLIAIGVAMIGVLGSVGAYTSIRAIGKRAHPLHMMMSFSLQSIVVSAIAIPVTRTPVVVPSRISWLFLLLQIGIFGFVAQIFLTMGLQRETVGRGTLAIYTQVVFSAILDRVFFNSLPSVSSIIGTLIIVVSAVWVAVSKETSSSKASNTTSTSQSPRPSSKSLNHTEEPSEQQQKTGSRITEIAT